MVINLNKKYLYIIAVLISFNYFIWQTVIYYSDATPYVYFLNVGQGDSILIKTPDHKYILVDGGPDDKVIQELNKVLPIWNRKIDLMVLTHPQADHLTGLLEVLKRFKVNEILATFVNYATQTNEEWLRIVQNDNYLLTWANASSDYYFDGLLWDTLYPIEVTNNEMDNINETSIVAQVSYEDYKVLLTGDAGFEVENKLMECYKNLSSEVLKVGHHGSKYASSEEFLSIVQPKIAIIQVGENKYGHPASETLNRLKNINAIIYRNDIEGTMKVNLKDLETSSL